MLLDTHVLLWFMQSARELGPLASASIRSAAIVYASAASLWEIAIKMAAGRLEVRDDLLDKIEAARLEWLPVSPTHAWGVRNTVGLRHGDPFDRLLVAQAMAERLAFVTADRAILGAMLAPELSVVDARE